MRLLPERQCVGCSKQAEWGCEAKQVRTLKEGQPEIMAWSKPAAIPLLLDGVETYACPRQHVRENGLYWSRVLRYYGAYEAGFLPERGAVIDQSNRLIDILRVVKATNSECDEEAPTAKADQKGDPRMRGIVYKGSR